MWTGGLPPPPPKVVRSLLGSDPFDGCAVCASVHRIRLLAGFPPPGVNAVRPRPAGGSWQMGGRRRTVHFGRLGGLSEQSIRAWLLESGLAVDRDGRLALTQAGAQAAAALG
jgi:hypothetical protein